MQIVVDAKFRNMLPVLTDGELAALHESLQANGCEHSLVVWEYEGQNILLDGHNRYDYCEPNGIPYKTTVKTIEDIPDRQAAEDWIDCNQLGSRNLTNGQRDVVLGRRYNRKKLDPKDRPGHRNRDAEGHFTYGSKSCVSRETTRAKLAKEHGVSERKVQYAGEIARAIDVLEAIDPEMEAKVFTGTAPNRRVLFSAATLVRAGKNKEAEAVLITKTPSKATGTDKPKYLTAKRLSGMLESVAKMADYANKENYTRIPISLLYNEILGLQKELMSLSTR